MRSERPTLESTGPTGHAIFRCSLTGNHLNRRGSSVGTITCALRTPDNLNPVDVSGGEVCEIEISTRIVDLHTIDEKQIGILSSASRVDACRSAAPARVYNRKSGHIAKQFI